MFMELCIIYTDLFFLHNYHFFLDIGTTSWYSCSQAPLTSIYFSPFESPCIHHRRGFYFRINILCQLIQNYTAEISLEEDDFTTINIVDNFGNYDWIKTA